MKAENWLIKRRRARAIERLCAELARWVSDDRKRSFCLRQNDDSIYIQINEGEVEQFHSYSWRQVDEHGEDSLVVILDILVVQILGEQLYRTAIDDQNKSGA